MQGRKRDVGLEPFAVQSFGRCLFRVSQCIATRSQGKEKAFSQTPAEGRKRARLRRWCGGGGGRECGTGRKVRTGLG